MPDVERQKAKFKCLRCGSEFELPYTPGKIEERHCPDCESNSVRRRKAPPRPEDGQPGR